MSERITIDMEILYKDITGEAKLNMLSEYVNRALHLAGEGNEVVLTGRGPIWLYLKIAHALHGKIKKLIYNSPVTGEVVIFDHDPF
ncbi:MAG: CRISPR-associated protein Csx3 [Nitrospirota bacterium]